MIYYSINYRSPFEKDKMLLSFLQLNNESIYIKNKINKSIDDIQEIDEIESEFLEMKENSLSENLLRLINFIK